MSSHTSNIGSKNEQQLPNGWKLIQLSHLCDLQNGYAFKSKDYVDFSNTLNCRMSNIRPNGEFNLEYNPKYLPDSYAIEFAQYLLQDDDVIIAMTDMASEPKILGVPTIVETKGRKVLLNQRVGKLVVKDFNLIHFPYLKRILSTKKVRSHYLKFAGGGVQINLGKKDLLSVKIPLPPIEEQRRIAAIADQADAIRRKRKEAIRLTESLLRSAFLDMFGDPGTNPRNWTIGTVEDIAELVTDGTHHTPKRTPEGIPLLSARNIKNGFIDTSEALDFIPEDEYQRLKKRYDPKIGDVLISCSGSVGRVAVVRHSQPFSMVRSVAVIRAKGALVLPEYLESLFHSSFLQASIARGSKKSSQANLFQGAIKELPVYIPPIPLQKEWSDLKTKLRAMIQTHQTGIEAKNILFSSILQRAFRGEL